MGLHPKRRCKCTEHTGDEAWHGRPVGYVKHACRCAACRAERVAAARAWRDANPERHRASVNAWRRERWQHDSTWREAKKARWRASHPAGERADYQRAYHLANPTATKARDRVRKSRERAVAPNLRGPWARWTAAEDRVALDPSLTVLQVAWTLGRSPSSVTYRRRILRKMQQA